MPDSVIPRPVYLDRVLQFKDSVLIKVITGIRRCGKSKVLELYENHLLSSGVAEDHIIFMNFERMEYDTLRDYKALYDAIRGKMTEKDGHYYLLLDEIQTVEHWEKAIASLNAENSCDITITGSNAWLLSSELSTLLSGRYVEIKVLPLSFKEYLQFSQNEKTETLQEKFSRYLQFGAFPFILSLPQEPSAVNRYLESIYTTVLTKDILSRSRIKDPDLLERLIKYIAQTTGNYLSPNKISGCVSSTAKGTHVKSETIANYLSVLKKAFVIYEVPRFDIKGKDILKTLAKYYIIDTGLRNMLLGYSDTDFGFVLETVVYFELLRRGYQVFVGKYGTAEVDFVAVKPEEKLYVQVTESVRGEEVRKRELAPLLSIPDNYRKIILSLDETYVSDHEGIVFQNLIRFLLEE